MVLQRIMRQSTTRPNGQPQTYHLSPTTGDDGSRIVWLRKYIDGDTFEQITKRVK